ncbi:probable terpene synthase 6 [Tripterygium wilfordii]|uniref:probable terpene synthase 6 n=1 Tax=Tripterygium wilfordii TaxID=458696 RepID=UPI0018F826CB|nr:probable terpene synthase 6 [Tripterygium wilfordii]
MATLTAVPLGLPSHTKQVISPPLWNKPAVFATGFSTGFTMNKSPRRPNYQVQASTKTDQEILRKRANFAPNMWGDHFNTITSSTFSVGIMQHYQSIEYESYTREVNVLKEEVKDMLMAATRNPVQNIHLIDLLSRLGLAYHYETEIELQLHHIFYGEDNIFRDHDYDLDTMARLFRLCRQYGYDISCVVFNKFLDGEGKLKANLVSDTKAMLNLYEACHVSLLGEDILDKALSLTTTHLKALVKETSQHLAQHIMNALEQPFHKGAPRLEARKYIAFYEKEECRHDKILKFAKLDFNRVQLLYQQELNHLTSWWKDTNLASECPYTRDRIVEMYGWAAISTFEPYYGRARIIYTKTIMLQSAMDDGYDSYGTPEELESFTEAIQRWDMSAMDLLPDYLKNYYRILLNHYEELDKEMTAEGRPYSVSRLKELVKEVSDAYHKETQWFDKGYIPPFNEYMMTARITGSCQVITAASFVGMENATADAFEWLQSSRRLIMAVNTILRLTNDILSHKREQTTGESASSIECYMRQYSLSEEEVIENFEKTIANQWKIINEEFMKPTPISNHLVSVAINQARSCGPWFQFGDAYTEPEYAKDIISLMFIEKIHI